MVILFYYFLKHLKKKSKIKPTVVIARTIKGKGIKEMEGKLEWHYKSPDKEKLKIFIEEIGSNA